MFLEAAFLGVLIGWWRRGRLRNLNAVVLSGFWLAVVALLLQIALWVDFYTVHLLGPATPYLHIFSYLPLLGFTVLNRRRWPMFICCLGMLLNLAVIGANGGFMPVETSRLAPVYREELLDGTASPVHAPMDESSRLAFLGDILRLPYGKYKVISPGDIILAAGLLLFIQQGMIPPREEREN